ncbi:tRNA-uridine aminocarboxypropyltransferase [Ideonella margarita]|uniref:tRNA-uridine aminocarboxypropyltransferase n=1 Tax=Ideonella margarita TaxID=2984191 RepID=A0ABU9C880_9BURK
MAINTSRASRRLSCATCLRLRPVCVCGLVQPACSPVRVLLLQHPKEVGETKGTARLLQLCLGAGAQLEVGEVFEPQALAGWLQAEGRRSLLLYPPVVGVAAPPIVPDEAWATLGPQAGALAHPEEWQLVVLDATWRKSLKMLQLNPALQALPRCNLLAPSPGCYRALRKARRPDQLSTFEATAAALGQLQGGDAGASVVNTLMPVMAAFVAAGIAARGRS